MTRVKVDDQLFLLNEQEIRAIRNREKLAICISAFIGAMGVLLQYIPYYKYPEWFHARTVTVLDRTFDLPLIFLAYSILLVAIELILLTMLNIWCTHEIAVATGFLDHKTKPSPDKRNLMLDIGLEKKNKQVLTYGIDPLLGLNKKALLIWNLIFILKATLTNMFFRFMIQRVMGRSVVKAVQDFAGIPVFAFWNAYGTYKILKEARVVIMGQNLIEELIGKLQRRGEISEEGKSLISDTMQYIAVSKRDFHQNHYIMTRNLFEYFGIEERNGDWDENIFLEKIDQADPKLRENCILLILVGLILDGRISSREKARIRKLYGSGHIPFDVRDMEVLANDFKEGRGIQDVFKRYLA